MPEEAESNEAFLEEMIELLPEVRKYADFADIFCETGVFSVEESKRYMEKLKKLALKLKFMQMKLIH